MKTFEVFWNSCGHGFRQEYKGETKDEVEQDFLEYCKKLSHLWTNKYVYEYWIREKPND